MFMLDRGGRAGAERKANRRDPPPTQWVFALLSVAVVNCDGLQNSASSKLESCLASTEQIILLRQMTMTGASRENFEFCRGFMGMTDSYCRGLYLNANSLVRKCMNDAGYLFLDVDFYASHGQDPSKQKACVWSQYEEPKCYHWSLWSKLGHWWAFRATQ
jgi:hypothetical protein